MPFARPTTTATPDEIFEEWVHVLRHAELLALLYVVRRTLGFKKVEDGISYTQFLDGITTREGKVLDRGCGIKSRGTLAAALRRLEELGLIRSHKAQDARGDRATTRYSLWFAGDEDHDCPSRHTSVPDRTTEGRGPQIEPRWYANRTTPSARIEPPLVRESNQQQTDETTNTRQQTDLSRRKAHAYRVCPPLDSTDSRVMTKDDITTGIPPYSGPSLVSAHVAHLSAEFGDDAPLASCTRVLNMQRVGGLSSEALLSLLDEAAAITRSQGPTITKRGRGGAIIRMPYLLATLRGLVVATDDPTMATAPASGAPIVSFPVPPDIPAVDDSSATTEAEVVWRVVLGEVRRDITAENYTAWFAPARALTLEENVLRVAVPTLFHQQWLEHKLRGCVERALGHTGHMGVHIVYDVAPLGDTIPPAAQTMGQAVAETVASPALSPTTALAVLVPAHRRQGVMAGEWPFRVPIAVRPPVAVAPVSLPSITVSSSSASSCETTVVASGVHPPLASITRSTVASIAVPLPLVARPSSHALPLSASGTSAADSRRPSRRGVGVCPMTVPIPAHDARGWGTVG